MATPDDCHDCPLHTRRDFLQQAVVTLGATFGVLGLAPLPLSALATTGSEKRYPLPATDGAYVDAEAEVIVARAAGSVYAFALACPHQRTALRWEANAGRFRCPKHKSVFAPDGRFVEGKATRPMDRLPIRRDGEALVVNTATIVRHDHARAAWEAAVVRVAEK